MDEKQIQLSGGTAQWRTEHVFVWRSRLKVCVTDDDGCLHRRDGSHDEELD